MTNKILVLIEVKYRRYKKEKHVEDIVEKILNEAKSGMIDRA